MKYQNIVVPVSNYATSALQETLTLWGKKGYRFVNSVMASNQYNCTIMYLFFVKGSEDDGRTEIQSLD